MRQKIFVGWWFAAAIAAWGCASTGVVVDDTGEGPVGGGVDGDSDGFAVGGSGPVDCDDGDASIYPGAPELCDGVDNDCDGETDTDATSSPTWFRDADGDTFGLSTDVRTVCEAPEGYVERGGDCDDTDEAIRPGADDPACDGIDQDCDGVGETEAARLQRAGASFASLQEAFDAVDGDEELVVCPGRWEAAGRIDGGHVVVRSFSGSAADTVLVPVDGSSLLRVDDGALTLRDLRVEGRGLDSDTEGVRGGVVFASDADVTLDGVEVADVAASDGGVVYFETTTTGDRTVRLLDSVFIRNRADLDGAVLAAKPRRSGRVRLLIENSRILQSRTTNGAAVHVQALSAPVELALSGGDFRGNTGGFAGAVYLVAQPAGGDEPSAASVTVSDTLFINNATSAVGAVSLSGVDAVRFDGAQLTNNRGGSGAGGLFVTHPYGEARVALVDSTFNRNSSTDGAGAIQVVATSPARGTRRFELATEGGAYEDNTSGGEGGVLGLQAQFGAELEVSLAGSVFAGNTSDIDGGVARAKGFGTVRIGVTGGSMTGNTAAGQGGVFAVGDESGVQRVALDAVTVSGNQARTGGALWLGGEGDIAFTGDEVVFDANTATGVGGAVRFNPVVGGSFSCEACDFTNNAAVGGGAFTGGSIAGVMDVTLVRGRVLGNTATDRVGAAFDVGRELTFSCTSTNWGAGGNDNEDHDLVYDGKVTMDRAGAATYTCRPQTETCQ